MFQIRTSPLVRSDPGKGRSIPQDVKPYSYRSPKFLDPEIALQIWCRRRSRLTTQPKRGFRRLVLATIDVECWQVCTR